MFFLNTARKFCIFVAFEIVIKNLKHKLLDRFDFFYFIFDINLSIFIWYDIYFEFCKCCLFLKRRLVFVWLKYHDAVKTSSVYNTVSKGTKVQYGDIRSTGQKKSWCSKNYFLTLKGSYNLYWYLLNPNKVDRQTTIFIDFYSTIDYRAKSIYQLNATVNVKQMKGFVFCQAASLTYNIYFVFWYFHQVGFRKLTWTRQINVKNKWWHTFVFRENHFTTLLCHRIQQHQRQYGRKKMYINIPRPTTDLPYITP